MSVLQRVRFCRGEVSVYKEFMSKKERCRFYRVQVRRGSVGFIIFVSVEMRCRFTKYSGSLERGVWTHGSNLSD